MIARIGNATLRLREVIRPAMELVDPLLAWGDTQDFVRTWREVSPVLCWDHRPSARRLYELAANGPGEGAIVEIGSYLGNSTVYLARGSLSRGRECVHAVDPHTIESMSQVPAEQDVSQRFLSNLERFRVHHHVRYHRLPSAEAAQVWDGGPIRLLFIDGLHTCEAVREDYSAWAPHLASEHVVVFDDYLWAHVARAIRELRSEVSPAWYATRGGQALFSTRPLSIRLAGLP